MKIFADLKEPAFSRSRDLDWIASPLPGVYRRMLDRDGEEVARATSLVSYHASSYFSPHTHGGGEEFLVLEGIFSDETGNFPAGYYVRNPVGSSHQPSSAGGCVILVKLQQMHPGDQTFVRIDTNTEQQIDIDEVPTLPLHQYGKEQVLMRFPSRQQAYNENFSGGFEMFVTNGKVSFQGHIMESGDWIRLPGKGSEPVVSFIPSTLFVKKGHLA